MSSKSFRRLTLVVAAAIFLYFIIMVSYNAGKYGGSDSYGSSLSMPDDTSFNGLNNDYYTNNPVPYQYRRTIDSINKLKEEQERENDGKVLFGNNFGIFGAYSKTNWKGEAASCYYFSIKGYQLDPHCRFFVNKGTYRLAYPHWDSTTHNNRDGSYEKGRYEQRQIPIRYSRETETVMIPVSKSTFNKLTTTMHVMDFAMVVAILYLFVKLPIQILGTISDGNPFDQRNIKRFKIMTASLLVWSCWKLLALRILSWCLSGFIPTEFTIADFIQSIFDNLGMFLITGAVFLMGKAFQRGYKLQQENDLTI